TPRSKTRSRRTRPRKKAHIQAGLPKTSANKRSITVGPLASEETRLRRKTRSRLRHHGSDRRVPPEGPGNRPMRDGASAAPGQAAPTRTGVAARAQGRFRLPWAAMIAGMRPSPHTRRCAGLALVAPLLALLAAPAGAAEFGACLASLRASATA